MRLDTAARARVSRFIGVHSVMTVAMGVENRVRGSRRAASRVWDGVPRTGPVAGVRQTEAGGRPGLSRRLSRSIRDVWRGRRIHSQRSPQRCRGSPDTASERGLGTGCRRARPRQKLGRSVWSTQCNACAGWHAEGGDMRISLARTRRLATVWRRPSEPACTAGRTARGPETCAGSSLEDWARYGGGLITSDDGGRSVTNVPTRNDVRSR